MIKYNTKTIRVPYKWEHNNKCKKQVILLMITDGKKWHYLAVTNLWALLQGISSNHEGKFDCEIALIRMHQKINWKNMKKIPTNQKSFYPYPQTSPWLLFILKDNCIYNHVKKIILGNMKILTNAFNTKR